jgi:hypothetical protein
MDMDDAREKHGMVAFDTASEDQNFWLLGSKDVRGDIWIFLTQMVATNSIYQRNKQGVMGSISHIMVLWCI